MKYLMALAFFTMTSNLLAEDLPGWVKNPQILCSKGELCAVGEGESLNRAKRAARLALGKIFKTRVKSTFNERISSSGGEVSTELSDEIEEMTDVELEGVEIKKTFETNLGYYALAALNKRKTANIYKKEIKKIDDQIKVLWNEASPASILKINPLFQKRELVDAKVVLLTGFSETPPVSYKEYLKARKKASEGMMVFVYLEEEDPKDIQSLLTETLSTLGYRTTNAKIKKDSSTHAVTGSYTAEKQFLNVDGFEKYKFTLNLKASNNQKSGQSGTLTHSVVSTGRDFQQASERALPEVKEFIKNNLDQLNIE